MTLNTVLKSALTLTFAHVTWISIGIIYWALPLHQVWYWSSGRQTVRPNDTSAMTVRPKVIDTSADVTDSSVIVGQDIVIIYIIYLYKQWTEAAYFLF